MSGVGMTLQQAEEGKIKVTSVERCQNCGRLVRVNIEPRVGEVWKDDEEAMLAKGKQEAAANIMNTLLGRGMP